MKHLEIIIRRTWQDKNQTSGILSVIDETGKTVFARQCLERGWRDNKKNVSCIPSGHYTIVFEYSEKYERKLWEIKDVHNRSECKIHPLNHWFESNGCIGVGRDLITDFNNDGYLDLTHSTDTLEELHKILDGSIVNCIEIIDDLVKLA